MATEDLGSKVQRTRRNVMKMGSILAGASIAGIKSASAASTTTAVSPVARHSCFLKGTKIQTAEGERRVEDLAIGDLLPTMFGGMRPVQWIGLYPLKKSDASKPWVRDALPVRIARSALAPDIPKADLYVTGWHALFIDGLLAAAGCLINGTTIARYEAAENDKLEFFHIKLESHDVIYAEGAPVETLREVNESAVNFAEYSDARRSENARDALCSMGFIWRRSRRIEVENPQRNLALA